MLSARIGYASVQNLCCHQYACHLHVSFSHSTFISCLSSYKSAWLVSLLMLIIQCIICVLVIKTGNKTFDGNTLTHSVLCLDDSLERMNLSLVTYLGWFMCSIILVVFLLPDFLDGALLIYESVMTHSHKEILAGIVLMSRLVFLKFASFICLQASSVTDV